MLSGRTPCLRTPAARRLPPLPPPNNCAESATFFADKVVTLSNYAPTEVSRTASTGGAGAVQPLAALRRPLQPAAVGLLVRPLIPQE